MSVFYDHLLPTEALQPELAKLVTAEELEELLDILDETLHYELFDLMLQHVPPHAHDLFLQRVSQAPADAGHIVFLQQYAPDIEDRLRVRAADAGQRFLDAIQPPPHATL